MSREIDLTGYALEPTSLYPKNKVRSTRYNPLIIVPKNLFEQFHRFSNIWFLTVSIFQLIPITANPTASWTTIAPFSFLLGFTFLKDAYDDHRRHKGDTITNSWNCRCWNGVKFEQVKWKDLQVGHIINVLDGEKIPADILLLSADNSDGTCYVSRSGILGKTELKQKTAVAETHKIIFNNEEELALKRLSGKIKLDDPNNDFSSFNGYLKLRLYPKSIDLSLDNSVFRGSTLKGTNSIIGVVVYAGKETKIHMNIQKPLKKTSRIEKRVNEFVLYILLFLQLIVAFSLIFQYFVYNTNYDYNTFESYVNFVLLYNNIIPISLFVTIDIIRIFQIWIIERQTGGEIEFRTGDLNEDLGQVEYILADKTGTITDNNLVLETCIIGLDTYTKGGLFESYLTINDEEKPLTSHIENQFGMTLPELEKTHEKINIDPNNSSRPLIKLKDEVLYEKGDSQILHFIKCMALCNSCVIENERNWKFIGISVEEKLLLESAKFYGLKVINMNPKTIVIEWNGALELYKVIASRPYSSITQKCSIVLEKEGEDYAILYSKGCLEQIIPLLDISHEIRTFIEEKTKELCFKGQRTIIEGCRIISPEENFEFKKKLEIIRSSPINSEVRMEILFQDMEANLSYLGIVGIEDSVSLKTQEAVTNIQEAGIKIWLLSSDEEIPCITAAYKSNLLKKESPILKIHGLNSQFLCSKALQNGIMNYIYGEGLSSLVSRMQSYSYKRKMTYRRNKSVNMHMRSISVRDSQQLLKEPVSVNFSEQENDDPDVMPFQNGAEKLLAVHTMGREFTLKERYSGNFQLLDKSFSHDKVKFSVTIDRISFDTAYAIDETRKLLVCLLLAAESICFYGFLPQDKAKVVKLLKENASFRPLTLAIGDGNGDIPMIQEADIGVGIINNLESQAQNYGEINVKDFEQLERLLLVYGFWNYLRITKALLLYLYKNFILTYLIFVFVWVSEFSGTLIFDGNLLIGYNILFTTVPIILLGIFDQPISQKNIYENLQVYSIGILNKYFNAKRILKYISFSFIQALLISILIFYSLDSISNEGKTENIDIIGVTMYIIMVFSILLQVFVETFRYSILYLFSHVLSISALILCVTILTCVYFDDNDLYQVGLEISNYPIAIILILTVPLASMIPNIIYKHAKALLFPTILEEIKSFSMSLKSSTKFSRLKQFSNSLRLLYKSGNVTHSTLEYELFDINKYTLNFISRYIERFYKETYIAENKVYFRIITTILWAFFIVWSFIEIFWLNSVLSYNLIKALCMCGLTIILFFVWTDIFHKKYVNFVIIAILIAISIKFIIEMTYSQVGTITTACIPALTFILFNVDWIKNLGINVFAMTLFFFSISINYPSSNDQFEETLDILSFIIIILSIAFTLGVVGYFIDFSKRIEHKYTRLKEIGIEKTQNILAIFLPSFVSTRVKDGARYIAEDQGIVTVVFCDIYDFDTICTEYKPNELTSFLDQLFQEFDQICTVVGMTKIETVGKTYMACGGLKDSDNEMIKRIREIPHARRAVELGLAMISHVQTLCLKSGAELKVKIGINSGPVTAGVVGFHKPQFSLVGDTVNTASRMCSTLKEANNIQISKETYEVLENYTGLSFDPREVEAKGKGIMQTFIVTEVPDPNSASMQSAEQRRGSRLSSVTQNSYDEIQTDMTTTLSKLTRYSTILDHFELKNPKEVFKRNFTGQIKKVNFFDFSCKENEIQKQFREDKLKKSRDSKYIVVSISAICFGWLLIVSILKYSYLDTCTNTPILISRVIVVTILVLVITLHNKIYLTRLYPLMIIISVLFMCVSALNTYDNCQLVVNDLVAVEVMYIILILNYISGISITNLIWSNFAVYISWVITGSIYVNDSSHYYNIVLIGAFTLTHLSSVYSQENQLRIHENLRILAEKEIEKTDKLLTQMMPPNVLENLKQGKPSTDRLFNVTLLYADIVGFTAWSSNKTPQEVVGMLSELFTRFDKLCVTHGVYKVHTIGDCYVVMGYRNEESRDPEIECLNMINMAKDMIRIIEEVNEVNGSQLNMRIGLHTGEVIAGIIGTTIVRYDIYGPDVLIANNMESGGQAGKINISDVTKEMLEIRYPGHFLFTFNKEISVPTIGKTHNCFFIDNEV